MKSKYYQALVFIGILPVLAVTAVFLWALSNQAPPPTKGAAPNTAAVQAALPALKSQVDTMASSMASAIERINTDLPNLYAHSTDADLDNFMKTHPGVSGIVVLSPAGKAQQNVPASPPLITDPAYGNSEEFQKTVEKLKDNGGKVHLYYTAKLGYPAFVFAIANSSQSIVEVVASLANFFRGMDVSGGEISLLEAGSGVYLYHTNPAKITAPFNPNQEAWLAKIQNDLANKQGGSVFNPDKTSAVYAPVFARFGIVHLFPSSMLQPGGEIAVPSAPAMSLENLPEFFQSPMGMTLLITVAATVGWIFIMGSLFFGFILNPLRKASATILNAANGKGALTPDVAKRFGKNEVGQVVQASAMLMEKLEQEKQHATQEKEETLKRGRAEVEAKSREAADQVAAAQKQAQQTRNELNEKSQQFNDKVNELNAMKSMADGLRNQAEQARAEIGKIKSQVAAAEAAKTDVENSLRDTKAQLESQFKEMESKLLQAVSASSAIKVSQVRAAAIRTMSEELKTTLGIIKGYVSSALGASASGISEKQQEFLGMVINRSARLEKFINDLLDIYQVEIEQAEAKPEEVNLASEIEGLAFNFQAQAEVKNIKMKIEPKGTLPKVPIVRRRFNQLWNILYLQIIKDAPRGSSIPIGVEAVGDMVKVTVQDPGLTVTPGGLPKLYDEFYDPKHPASPQLAGTGLKFALVKTILAAHGGGAVAEKGDPGTKLILTFPTKFKKPGEAPIPAMPATAPKPFVAPASAAAVPGAKPPLMPPGGIGAPKPAVPGIAAPGLKPTVPGLAPPGIPSKPATPGVPGMAPAATAAPGMPKPAAPAATGGGVLDVLISKIPPPTAPVVKAPPPGLGMPGIPAAPKPPAPATPGMPAPPALGVPKPPVPGMPAPPPLPGAPKPSAAAPGLLDSLIEKKAPVPGAPAAPGIPAPPKPPGVPGMAAPPIPKPPMPPPGTSSTPPSNVVPLRPPVPPAGAGAPGMAAPPIPKPPMPPGMPAGMPGAPAAPKPPMPGAPPAAPGTLAPPKVVPTGLKPAPTPGVLDLESSDTMKLDVGAPKPPMPGGLKPPAPGVPPGGLQTNPPPKKDEGELIE